MLNTRGSNIYHPLLSRLLLQTPSNISIKDCSHLRVPDHHPLDSGITCCLLMKNGCHAGCLRHILYNGPIYHNTRGSQYVVSRSSLGTEDAATLAMDVLRACASASSRCFAAPTAWMMLALSMGRRRVSSAANRQRCLADNS